MLPFLDGWQIISALRESARRTGPVFNRKGQRGQSERTGAYADDYLIKPFTYGAGCTCKNPTAPGTLAGRNSLHHRRYNR